jgi:hypothetical protein
MAIDIPRLETRLTACNTEVEDGLQSIYEQKHYSIHKELKEKLTKQHNHETSNTMFFLEEQTKSLQMYDSTFTKKKQYKQG